MKGKIDKFIQKHNLLSLGDKVVVGISGGADSMALLHFLHISGYDCVAAHCNFHLRGEESNRDEKFVFDFCQKWNIQLEITHFETAQIALDRHISIEMAARDLRYEWFEQLRTKHFAQAIAVAHHRDDSIETLLLNLIRGTGIRGLSGIAPKNGHIIRPFLCSNRSEIETYIDECKLEFVTDGTNAETIYLRNKLRLELLPWLEEINPAVREAIDRTSDHLRSVEQIYLAEIEKQRALVLSIEGDKACFSIPKLMAFSQPATLLFELLQPFGFNRNVCDEIFASLNGISGKVFYSPRFLLLKDRDVLIVKSKSDERQLEFSINETEETVLMPIKLVFEQQINEDFSPGKSKRIAYFDCEKLKFPLTLRRWQQSDWFVPFGMNGSKKVSDYFSDNKFNLIEKEEAWLLCSGDDIIWIVGERSDNRYRVNEKTKKILRINYL